VFDIILLVVALVVILAGAELFTNGIEWFGRKLNLAEGAVGSVLAAVGTALPETMIPIIAILFAGTAAGAEASHAVGVGAILGAPFMLSTLAMFVTGVAVLSQAKRRTNRDLMPVNTRVLGKDIRFFFLTYALAIAAAFVPAGFDWVKVVVAVVLVVLYALYVRAHFVAEAEAGHGEELAPLRFHRFDRGGIRIDPGSPRMRVVSAQVLAALGLIIAGAIVFVGAVTHVAETIGVAPAILSLVIAPIATELPEKFNSVLWVRTGKDTLAMGNITGAMVFQSCIPVVFALLFASDAWTVTADPESIITFASAGIAFASTAVLFLPMMRSGRLTGRGLVLGGLFYLAYLVLVALYLGGAFGAPSPTTPH
jgi:cation:H+ antiporter